MENELQSEAFDRFHISEILEGASSRAHLEREKSLAALEKLLASAEADRVILEVERGVSRLVQDDAWEARLGGLKAAKILLSSGRASAACMDDLAETCICLLEDREVRVRWAVGEVIRALCEQRGTMVWQRVGPAVLKSIHENFDRDAIEPSGSLSKTRDEEDRDGNEDFERAEAEARGQGTTHNTSGQDNPVLAALLQRTYRAEPPGVGEMRHGTEGWKCLETSFRAFQHAMEGCGEDFQSSLTEDLRKLIYRGLSHPNRFVREACHFIMGSVCRLLDDEEFSLLAPELATKLGLGLSDNWSQVRYAASVATRTFALRLQAASSPLRDDVLPLIIPHMCLNRYYVAEGVRLYSQETWRMVMKDEGRSWVARSASRVVSYYIEQSKANNHAVREAACACIAELMCKVDQERVCPHVSKLLRALINCFKDASWPVRDAACLACGKCVTVFPEESKEILEDLYELWFSHLWDNIYSVREDSAVALGNVARTYGDDAVERIVQQIGEMLPMAKSQPNDSRARAGMENTTLFGVAAARKERANDPTLHTNLTMYSCGSLAPKLRRGGGCIDHGFARDKEPWEASDGAIYMLRELSSVAPDEVVSFLPELADISRLTHFSHCLNLQETLWKCLPVIARNVGKKKFKPLLNDFLEPMFRGLTCGQRLCESAAGQCIGAMRDLIGPGVFEGRLLDEQRRLLHTHHDIPPPKGPLAGRIAGVSSGSIAQAVA